MVEISVEVLRLFGDERWNREKKNRSTGDNNDESVHAGGRETDERNDEAGDRMPRVFPSTCDRDLSLRHFARCEFLFLNASDSSRWTFVRQRNCSRTNHRAR